MPRVIAQLRHFYCHSMFVWFKAFIWQVGALVLGEGFFGYSCIILHERTEGFGSVTGDTLGLDG